MNILVTGGAGYIGSGLLLRLGEELPEASITSVDNLAIGDYSHIDRLKKNKHYRLLVGDVAKKSDVKKAITRDTDTIIHLAAISGIPSCTKQPRKAIITNTYGTHLLLREAVSHTVEKFIFTSSAAVYGIPKKQPISEEHALEPINLYGITKVAAENLVNACYANYGLTTITLRLSNVYGLSAYTHWEPVVPKFVWQAANDQSLTIRADGKQQRNFVHIYDVIEAVIQCLKAPRKAVSGETFNIGGEALSVNQIADIITQDAKQRFGKKIKRVYMSLEPGEVYTPEFGYSYKRASQKIGYRPKRELSHGVSELFDYALKVEKKPSG